MITLRKKNRIHQIFTNDKKWAKTQQRSSERISLRKDNHTITRTFTTQWWQCHFSRRWLCAQRTRWRCAKARLSRLLLPPPSSVLVLPRKVFRVAVHCSVISIPVNNTQLLSLTFAPLPGKKGRAWYEIASFRSPHLLPFNAALTRPQHAFA